MIKKSIFFSVLLIVLLGAYYVIISLSERRDFSKSSLDYYLLAPNLFKNLSSADSIGNATFIVLVTVISQW